MGFIRFTILNKELIKNLPSSMREELIYFEEVIPNGIMASLCVNDSVYNKKRNEFLNHRPDLLDKIYFAKREREVLIEKDKHNDPVTARINVETDEKIQFIKKYPQFKQLILSVEFCDEDLNTIKIVPIDQYLEGM